MNQLTLSWLENVAENKLELSGAKFTKMEMLLLELIYRAKKIKLPGGGKTT